MKRLHRLKSALLSALLWATVPVVAIANTIVLPFTFTNGSTIDATQMMSQFNSIVTVVNGGLDGANFRNVVIAFANAITLNGTGSGVSAGSGAPTANCGVGSLYLRTDASSVGTASYLCQPANTWSTIGSVATASNFTGSYSGTTYDPDVALAAGTSTGAGCADASGNFYEIRRDTTPKIWVSKYAFSTTVGVTATANNGGVTDADFNATTAMAACTVLSGNIYAGTDQGTSATNKIKVWSTSAQALLQGYSIATVGQPYSVTTDGTNIFFILDCQAGVSCAGAANYQALFKMTPSGTFTNLATLNAGFSTNAGFLLYDGTNLWATYNGATAFYKYTVAGVLSATYNNGNVNGLCTTCYGLAFDSSNNPWTLKSVAGGTWTFYKMNGLTPTSATTFTTTWYGTNPVGIVAPGDGNLYATSGPTQGWLRITPAGAIVPYWSQFGQFNVPGAVAPIQNFAMAGSSGIVVALWTNTVAALGGGVDFFGALAPSGWLQEKFVTGVATAVGQSGPVLPGTVVTIPGTAFTGVNTYLPLCTPTMNLTAASSIATLLKVDNVSTTTFRVAVNGTSVTVPFSCRVSGS